MGYGVASNNNSGDSYAAHADQLLDLRVVRSLYVIHF